jgi:RNA ligase (TIGR02306 family)
MSTKIIVEVCRVEAIGKHANADKLDIAQIKGWQVIVPKDSLVVDTKVIYFPPDSLLPQEWTDKFGVTKYCNIKPDGVRVRSAKLRNEYSHGFAVDATQVPEINSWEVGVDVADIFGARKYEPPIKVTSGDMMVQNPLLVKFTDIENWRNFPDVIQDGEMVVISEKVHGANDRTGVIEDEKLVAGACGYIIRNVLASV